MALRGHLAPAPQDLRVKCRRRVELDFGPLECELFKIIQNTINKNQKNFNLSKLNYTKLKLFIIKIRSNVERKF